MKASDDLFELIHAMDANEKGYFKKYAQLNGTPKSNHLLLFDAINKQTEYNEAQIIKKFKEYKLGNNLSSAKYYLTDLILRSLRAYRESNSMLMKLNALIENTETLFMKGLYTHGMKMLEKCMELSHQMDDHVKVLEVQIWQRKFISGMSAHNMEHEVDNSIEQSEETITHLSNYTTLRKLYYKSLWLIRKNMNVQHEDMDIAFKEIVSHPLVNDENLSDGFHQKLALYNIHNIYNYLVGNYEASYHSMVRIIDLWENHPMIREQNMDLYIAALNNYINACLVYNRPEELKKQLDNIEQIKVQGIGLKAKLFENVALWKLYYGVSSGDPDYLLNLIGELEEGMKTYEGRIHEARPLIINHSIAMIYFINEKYDLALQKTNELLDIKKIDMRKDIQATVRFCNLMIHYELGNEEMLEYAIRSVRRYFESQHSLTEFHKLLLSSFNKVIGKSDKKERKEAIQEFKEKIENFYTANKDKKAYLDLLDLTLMAWIDSKLKNKSIKLCFVDASLEMQKEIQ